MKPHRTEHCQPGYSLLELVVVLFVIVGMILILIPGIRRAQEVARRTSCSNNLKQITLALNNYHDTHGLFPPGYVSRNVEPTAPSERETGPGFAWGALLLPFLDQRPLYQTIDFSSGPGFVGANTILPSFQCPTNRTRTPSNYVGSAGFGNLTERPGAPAIPGILYRNSNIPDFDILDGLSHTILVGERAGVHNFVPGETPVPAGAEWLAAPPGMIRHAGLGEASVDEGSASLVLGTVGQEGPVAVDCPPLHSNHVAAFSSPHPGGLFVGMADGSVHFISDSIDFSTYRALGGRKDGESAALPRF